MSRPDRCSLRAFSRLVSSVVALSSIAACYGHSGPRDGAASPAAAPATGKRHPARDDDFGRRRFSGVDVVPTGRSAFLIRMNSALVGGGDLLYVIDGTPLTVDRDRGIDWFKAEDITAIRVLKTPSELSVFGPRGVNGVILITTRQGMNARD